MDKSQILYPFEHWRNVFVVSVLGIVLVNNLSVCLVDAVNPFIEFGHKKHRAHLVAFPCSIGIRLHGLHFE